MGPLGELRISGGGIDIKASRWNMQRAQARRQAGEGPTPN